ncbi:hypothetical protein [Jeotgalibaca caeni]|uniref:hypothetical protein n=1 Tax=Jeotgalibaca caeni TaxID=3028623 RepID=UPI00237D698B|nr:hypothetical protein [Jeotgalibaca caeni]MDE1549473.1 hypothetical protein [Jeotgalibaca caeni]
MNESNGKERTMKREIKMELFIWIAVMLPILIPAFMTDDVTNVKRRMVVLFVLALVSLFSMARHASGVKNRRPSNE